MQTHEAPRLRVVEAHREIYFDVAEGWPLVPDATYKAICRRVEIRQTFRAQKCYLLFRITEGEHAGKEIFKAYNVRKPLGRKSYLFKDLCRLLELPRNTRPHRVSPSELRGQLFTLTTRTVVRDYEGQPLPEGARYSTVAKLEAIEVRSAPLT